jgi:hypothetical protein
MRLYRLNNRSNNPYWVIAPDTATAIAYSVSIGRAKTHQNVKIIGDQTDFYLEQEKNNPTNLADLLEGNLIGIASFRIGLQRTWLLRQTLTHLDIILLS